MNRARFWNLICGLKYHHRCWCVKVNRGQLTYGLGRFTITTVFDVFSLAFPKLVFISSATMVSN
ncbi:hypothetical protein Hanom_Chr01g00010791 [Helianthus anomalus]